MGLYSRWKRRNQNPISLFGSNLSLWLDRRTGISFGTPPAVATWADRSANANNATESSPNQPDDGASGIDFVAASSERLQIADSASMDVTTQMVIGIAFTPDAVTSGFIFSKQQNYGVQISSGAMDLYYTGGGGNFIARGGTFTIGTDHRLIMAYDGTATGDTNRYRVWQEGTPITWSFAFGSSIPATLGTNGNPGWVGSYDGAGSYYDGRVRAVVLAKTTLDAAGLSALDAILAAA